jgi:plasmid stabilization system protein ParE
MKIKILDSAKNDLIEGYYFYEKQSEGLGTYFLDSLYSDIDSLQVYAGIHQKQYKDFYRLLSKRFPFAIYYRKENQNVVVDAVLDCRRDPAWIRKKLT